MPDGKKAAPAARVSVTPAPRKPNPWPTIPLSEVEEEPIVWLWQPYLVRECLNCVAGNPSAGKSWLTCAIAAALSRGQALPGAAPIPPQNSLILSIEDPAKKVLKPRLRMMGADMDRIFIPTIDPPSFTAEGILRFEDTMYERAATFVIVDPMQGYTDGAVDIYRANEVRQIMKPLAKMAERTGSCVVLVMHLRKEHTTEDMYKVLGSVDFIAAVRSAMLVGKDKAGGRFMRHVKCNYDALGDPLAFSVGREGFEWLGLYEEPGKAEKPSRKVSTTPLKSKASDWLVGFLSAGPRRSPEVVLAALQMGFAKSTLHLAKAGIATTYREGDEWYWALDADPTKGASNANG